MPLYKRLQLRQTTRKRKASRKRRHTVYVVRMSGTNYYKIGYTSGNVFRRLAQLQTGNPHRLDLVFAFDGTMEVEARLHEQLADKRAPANNEWFSLTRTDVLKLRAFR